MEAKKKFFMDCHLAGRMYHDADEVWDKLKVGTVLQLELDKDNRHDPNAVAVVYHDKEQDDDFLIGYIPRKLSQPSLKWAGTMPLNAASIKSRKTRTQSIRFI